MLRTLLILLMMMGGFQVSACNGKNASVKKATESDDKCLFETPENAPKRVSAATHCPADPVFGGVRMKTGELGFVDGQKKTVVVELAISETDRARGLMYRTHLQDGHGMLFIDNGPPRIQSFWMRNTCIPLDMLFIEKDGRIAGILENVPPMNTVRRSIPCPTNHVLEVPAGWCRKNNIKAGQTVLLPEY